MKRAFRITTAALCAALSHSAHAREVEDPVYVYYAGRDCRSDVIELEAFDRENEAWRAHPEHSRIPARSCQREDAGQLLNELRWRCQPFESYAPTPWQAIDVFEPEVMARCAVGQIDPTARRSAISVDAPREGVAVRSEDPRVKLEGSVRVDGVDGDEYDVLLLIDRSGPEAAVAAQTREAQAWVEHFRSRLGAVRVAVISYGGGSARVLLRWRHRFASIQATLRGIRASTSSSGSSPTEALEIALGLLDHARPAARRVLVLGVNGERFDELGSPEVESQFSETVSRVASRSADLHWRVLGGLAAEAPAVASEARGSYRRIAPADFETHFLSDLTLPVAESLWVENLDLEARGAGAVDRSGRFAARAPVQPGVNRLLIHAELSDGTSVERPFELVFNASWVLEKILEAERSKIQRVRQRRLELEVED